MYTSFRIWRVVPILVIGLYFIYKMIVEADEIFIFDWVSTLFLVFILVVIFIYNVYLDLREYNESRSVKSFIPTILGLCLIGLWFATDVFLKNRDKVPVIIEARLAEGCWFEFRMDSTFKFFNGGLLGGQTLRGSFSLRDSMILLKGDGIPELIDNSVVKDLVIRDFKAEGFDGKVLMPVDANKIIRKDLRFLVIVDKRDVNL